MRDRDVRNAILDALQATNRFDGVYLWSLKDSADQAAGDARAAAIQPISWTESDQWDDVAAGVIQIDAQCRLVLMARDESPDARDESAEQLLNAACNAINGQSLAGLTLPAWTKIRSARWKDAIPPERQIEATIVYRYLVDDLASFDETD